MIFGFPKQLLATLVCQKDQLALRVEEQIASQTHIIDGVLHCDSCAQQYVISGGIVNFLEGQAGVTDVMQDEIVSRDTEAARYNAKLETRYAKEVPSTLNALGDVSGKTVIEYGSGTGRFTKEIAQDATAVLAIDFSRASLEWARDNLEMDNVGFVLADASQIQTAQNSFGAVLSTQVLEHFPTQDQRETFVRNIAHTAESGARVVCTAYHHDVRRRNKPQEGRHDSGVFYHYFTAQEVKQLFVKEFASVSIAYIDVTLPGEVKLGLNKRFGGIISRISGKLPFVRQYAHLVMSVSVA